MTSWRSTTPQGVQDDLDALVTLALDSTQDLLTNHGEFFPFGVTMGDEGQAGLAAADPLFGERPESQLVLDALYDAAATSKAGKRAAAFVADVKANGANAVRVEAEHRDGGPALVVVVPYKRKGLRKKSVAYGQMSAGPGARHVWTTDA